MFYLVVRNYYFSLLSLSIETSAPIGADVCARTVHSRLLLLLRPINQQYHQAFSLQSIRFPWNLESQITIRAAIKKLPVQRLSFLHLACGRRDTSYRFVRFQLRAIGGIQHTQALLHFIQSSSLQSLGYEVMKMKPNGVFITFAHRARAANP